MREARRARARARGPLSPASSMISATVFSKKREVMPVAPTLPISSLSTRMHTLVRARPWGAKASCAASDV